MTDHKVFTSMDEYLRAYHPTRWARENPAEAAMERLRERLEELRP